MHYPKVSERVDSPEQIFHRSFSLGAPEGTQHVSTKMKYEQRSRLKINYLAESWLTVLGIGNPKYCKLDFLLFVAFKIQNILPLYELRVMIYFLLTPFFS